MTKGLDHIPWEYEVHTSTAKPWAKAANDLLDESAARGRDAIFVDDDIEILPETFEVLEPLIPYADVFGFMMLRPGGSLLSGGHEATDDGTPFPMITEPAIHETAYVSHVTASLMYLKRSAVEKLRVPRWPGQHYEDVAFSYDAWLKGLRVLYVPRPCLHDVTNENIGASKGKIPNFWELNGVNRQEMAQWAVGHGVREAIAKRVIPTGRLRLNV